jgi:hypothetical protein
MARKDMIAFHEKHGNYYVLFEFKQMEEVLEMKFDFNLKHYPFMYEDITDTKNLSVHQKAKIMQLHWKQWK